MKFKNTLLSTFLITGLLSACDKLSLNKNQSSLPPPPSTPVSTNTTTPSPSPAAPTINPPAPSANLVGSYSVQGTNPGGHGNYSGSATIEAGSEKDTYKIHWRVGTIYDGVGKLEGNSLNVKWGTAAAPLGTVIYTLEPGGILKGVWYTNDHPNLLGSEILRPQ